MTLPQLDYLIIACHPDDAEIGCGGAILSLKAQGAVVGVLDLTNGEPTPHGRPELRRRNAPPPPPSSASTGAATLVYRTARSLPISTPAARSPA